MKQPKHRHQDCGLGHRTRWPNNWLNEIERY